MNDQTKPLYSLLISILSDMVTGFAEQQPDETFATDTLATA